VPEDYVQGRRRVFLTGVVIALSTATALRAPLPCAQGEASPREQVEFFEGKIRPVLVEHCYKCHSAQSAKVRGKLLLDTRDGLRQGGESGPALVPGDPAASLLLKAIRYEEHKMPPAGKLPNG
jgi:hypothetical protein